MVPALTNIRHRMSHYQSSGVAADFDNARVLGSPYTVEGVFTPIGYFADNFNGSPNSFLINHTPDSGSPGWVTILGSPRLIGGIEFGSTNDEDCHVLWDSGYQDALITGRVRRVAQVTPGREPAIYFRWEDANNYHTVSQNNGTNTVKLYSMVSGVNTERASVSKAFSIGTTYTMQVRFIGDYIEYWVNWFILWLSYFPGAE
jgi:hypothetical protein